jgi:pimeloyl-ACP methyl ester carboxylesterase
MGSGQQAPLWLRLKDVSMPVSLIAGARDARYSALAEQMAHNLPSVDLAIVADAGHTVHQDQPERFVELVRTKRYLENSSSPRNVSSAGACLT